MKKLIGIDLGGTNVRAGLVAGSGIQKLVSSELGSDKSKSGVLEMIYSVTDRIFEKNISGIGVGVPSVVDTKKGIVFEVVNIPSWKKVPLKGLLEKRYNVPVEINNDANCFAMGEKYYGKGKRYKNLVGLIIGTGLGAGIIINNKLYEGRNCGAGEFGMIPFKDDIIETYCSGQFFSKFFAVKGSDLMKRKDDPEVKIIFDGFGRNLAEAIKIILYSYDPDIIILGGSVSKSFPLFKKAMSEGINTFAYTRTIKNIIIEVSRLRCPGVLGAAALLKDYSEKN